MEPTRKFGLRGVKEWWLEDSGFRLTNEEFFPLGA